LARGGHLLRLSFGGCWAGALVHAAAGHPLAGAVPLSLYLLDALAAASGWLCGNLFVTDRLRRGARGCLPLLTWWLGPMGALYLLFTLGPAPARVAAPLAPLWAYAIFTLFFLVPVSFRRAR
jgi:hypothetical protein